MIDSMVNQRYFGAMLFDLHWLVCLQTWLYPLN